MLSQRGVLAVAETRDSGLETSSTHYSFYSDVCLQPGAAAAQRLQQHGQSEPFCILSTMGLLIERLDVILSLYFIYKSSFHKDMMLYTCNVSKYTKIGINVDANPSFTIAKPKLVMSAADCVIITACIVKECLQCMHHIFTMLMSLCN